VDADRTTPPTAQAVVEDGAAVGTPDGPPRRAALPRAVVAPPPPPPPPGDGPERGSGGHRRPRIVFFPSRFRPFRTDRLPLRLALAAGIVVAAAFTNRTFLGWGLFATLALLFVPLGRARSFILSFVPYALVWFLFSALRSLADETILANTLNTVVARGERWLFGGQLPTITLQERFFDPNHLRWQDYFLTGIHWSYFLVPHAVAVRIWQRDPARFRRYLSALTLLLAVGLGIYFLLPSNPPWLAPDTANSPAAVQVFRVMEPVGKALGRGLYAASYRVIGESNPIAAMPSIHMAITFLLVFPVWGAGRPWRGLALAYSGLMALALVYLGEHYVVDIAVGMLIAAYGWFVAGVWLGRIAPVLRARFARSPGEAAPGVGTRRRSAAWRPLPAESFGPTSPAEPPWPRPAARTASAAIDGADVPRDRPRASSMPREHV